MFIRLDPPPPVVFGSQGVQIVPFVDLRPLANVQPWRDCVSYRVELHINKKTCWIERTNKNLRFFVANLRSSGGLLPPTVLSRAR